MSKIVIYGLGYMAEVMHYFFTTDSQHQVAGFVIEKEYKDKETFLNLPVIDFENIEDKFPANQYKLFIAVGYKKCNKVRTEKYNQAKAKNYSFVNYISSKAIIFDNLEIGENCCILEGTVVQPFAKLGNNIVIRSSAYVGHHATIGNNCFLGPNSVVLGAVQLGDYSFIGANATIRDYAKIAPRCVIGANALIIKDTQEGEVYKPHPAILAEKQSHQIKGLN